MTEARISQLAIEVVTIGDSSARISQLGIEVVDSGVPAARVSQLAVEIAVVATPPSRAVISQLAIEVLTRENPPEPHIVVGFPTYESHYVVRLVNRAFYECEITNYISLDYTLVTNDIGVLTLVLPGDFPRWRLQKDWRIEVWRGVGDRPLRLEGDTQFIIMSVTTEVDEGGNKSYKVVAHSLNEILKRRVVTYNANDIGYGYQIDQADDAMKAVMRQNYGTLATAARNISAYLSIDDDISAGPAIEMDVSWKYVLDVLRDMANAAFQLGTSLFFEIVATNPPGGLTFRVFTFARGADRRNTGKNAVVLSHANGSIGAYTIIEDSTDEVNYVYAFGSGEDDLKLSTEVTSAQEGPITIFFARREATLNNSQADTIDALDSEARALLVAKRPRKIFQGSITNVPGALYGVHWFFGDWVTAETDDDEEGFDCFIAAVHVSVTHDNETIEAALRNELT